MRKELAEKKQARVKEQKQQLAALAQKVFKKSDIKKCVVGDIKAAQLLEKASSYSF